MRSWLQSCWTFHSFFHLLTLGNNDHEYSNKFSTFTLNKILAINRTWSWFWMKTKSPTENLNLQLQILLGIVKSIIFSFDWIPKTRFRLQGIQIWQTLVSKYDSAVLVSIPCSLLCHSSGYRGSRVWISFALST